MFFTKKELQCKCGCNIYNVSPFLLYKLNTMRIILNRPLIITSACRCKQHNSKVQGSQTSLHITSEEIPCRAIDIKVANKHERMEIVKVATHLDFSGIGIANTFIHLSNDSTVIEGVYKYSS